MASETPLPSWAKVLQYVPHVVLGGIILWGYTQCEASRERQKYKNWRLDQCFIGAGTGERRCLRGIHLYTREECEEGAAGLRSMANSVSAECFYDSGDPQYPWKAAPVSSSN